MKKDSEIIREFEKLCQIIISGGLWWQEEVKQFLLQTRQNDREEFIEILKRLKGKKMKRQFPLAEKVEDRKYDCEIVSYNQAITEQNQKLDEAIKKYEEVR